MEEITEGKIALRKATADEIDFLKGRADKQGKESFTKTIPIAVIAVVIPTVSQKFMKQLCLISL